MGIVSKDMVELQASYGARYDSRLRGLRFSPFFTALHGMQRGLNDEISVRLSVRLSVCLSVCQTRAL